jgi:hypothetical protein
MATLRETVVVWKATGEVDETSRDIISDDPPCEYKCKWEDMQKQYTDPMGNIVISSAVLICFDEIPIKSFVRQGGLDCLTSTVYSENSDVRQVNGKMSAKNTRGTRKYIEYYL